MSSVDKARVLVVDDLPDVRATLSGLLSDEGYDVRSASGRVEALQMMDAGHFGVAVLDVRLDESDEDNQEGLLLMREIRQKDPTVAIIILTGYADVKMVREALQPDHEGIAPAFGFLEKSEMDKVVEYVNRAFERTVLDAALSVADLIAQGENDRVEFKSSMRWDFEKNNVNKNLQMAIAKTIAGMLNSKGGFLLIGVADDATIVGVEKDLKTLRKPNRDEFELTLMDIVQARLGIEYMRYIRPRFESVDDKYICVVSIKKSPSPVFLPKPKSDAHDFWVRIGNSTRSLDPKDTMIYVQTHWGKDE
ncbi:MAG: response regulator [Proteobacteria bacterium]|nr:response regulator [Pseudomonadota bacterium]